MDTTHSPAIAGTSSADGAAGQPETAPRHSPSEQGSAGDRHRPSTTMVVAAVLFLLVLLAGLFVLGWGPHRSAAELAREDAAGRADGVPTVAVAQAKVSAPTSDLVLPCNVQANQETAIYPRAAGYLGKLYVDIQDQVTAGQLLAEISAPDLDANLAHSKAALEQAQAAVLKAQTDVDLARRTVARYEEVQRSGSGMITSQEMDERRSAAESASGALILAKANVVVADADVRRLTVLQSFEKVTAPFAGTITTRNYDLGALLASTGGNAGKPLFTLAQSDPLRVFVNVPQVYATQIRDGQAAYLTVRNYPGREFTGMVARNAGAIDMQTRTLSFELHFPNPAGELMPGMYAQARLALTQERPALVIPVSAMLFNARGSQVAVVRDGRVHLQNISIGRDLGTELEVVDGLSRDDQIVINPDLRIAEGAHVQALQGSKPLAEADHPPGVPVTRTP